MIRIGGVLLAASSVFLIRSSFEMFILTPLYGPQMVFFSLMHTWPYPAVMVFFASWFGYYALVVFAVVVALSRLFVGVQRVGVSLTSTAPQGSVWPGPHVLGRCLTWLAGPVGRPWSLVAYLGATILLLHFVAATTYEQWSEAFFSGSNREHG